MTKLHGKTRRSERVRGISLALTFCLPPAAEVKTLGDEVWKVRGKWKDSLWMGSCEPLELGIDRLSASILRKKMGWELELKERRVSYSPDPRCLVERGIRVRSGMAFEMPPRERLL